MNNTISLSGQQWEELQILLKSRFEQNMNRHPHIRWEEVREILESHKEKQSALWEMEKTGGEPDVIEFENDRGSIVFFDCSAESPIGRRSLCYDREGYESRKEHKPQGNAMDLATSNGLEMLTEADYKAIFQFGQFDTKTSSWIKTPENIRCLGGALFGEYRYRQIFIYHNGAQSYYAARGFRTKLKIN